jgi:acyl-CoA thioesterase FadM
VNLYLRLLWLQFRWRFRSRLSVWDTSVTPFRVWPSDLDLLGHMNNSKYLAIMDLARTDLMYRSGSAKLVKDAGWYPVAAGVTIAYFASLNPWQTFDVHTTVLGLDDRWTFIEQKFVRRGRVCARAVVRTRFLKRSGGSVDHDELEKLFHDAPGEHQIPQWLRDWSENSKPQKP